MFAGLMKKISLFLALVFLFLALSGEEFSGENQQPAGSEKSGNVCSCDQYQDVKEPKKFFFAPSLRWVFLMTMALDMDLDFLVKHTEKGNNIYMGFTTGFRYSHFRIFSDDDGYDYDNFLDLPFHLNFAFDFKQKNRTVNYISLRLFGGADLLFGRKIAWNQETNKTERKYEGLTKIDPDGGIGFDVVFVNNVIMKTGFEFTGTPWPFLYFGLGYRL